MAAVDQPVAKQDRNGDARAAFAETRGATAMALYHRVPDKASLLNLAVDSLFLRVAEDVRPGDGWRAQLTNLWLDIRASLLAIPGAGEVFVRQPTLGPGTALTTEEMFRLLGKGGVSAEGIVQASDALTMLTIGSIANELTRPPQIRHRLGEQLPAASTPNMGRLLSTYSARDGTQRYEAALTWLLDGIDPS